MNILKKYLNYLRDNPNHLWFKRKLYGWGWTPVRWQGWLVIAIFILFLIWNGLQLPSDVNPSESELTWYVVRVAVAVIVLLVICYKTGEKPRWQWGIKD